MKRRTALAARLPDLRRAALATVLVIAAALLTPGVFAEEPALSEEAAESFTRDLVDELQTVAGAEDAEDPRRVARLREILRNELATGAIGRFVLSAGGRESASAQQLEIYEALFPDYIATAFAAEIDELAARRIEIDAVVPRPRGDEAIVQSRLISSTGRTAATVDWRVRLVDGEPRLLDVLVERVSPILTKREEIAAVLDAGGMAAVIAHMRQLIAGAATTGEAAENE